MELWSRRRFFLTSLAGSAVAGANKLFGRTLPDSNGAVAGARAFPGSPAQGKRPLIISSANGLHALDKGMDILKKGGDTLGAVVAAVTVVEDDPNDDSVGYGGLPNEEGEVELDASVMHGPTHRGGSVAGVRRIKNVSRLAKTVMEKTNHVMIVGDGARRFAVAEGFEEMNLLTEHSRKIWLAWKAKSSFNWRPGIDSPEWKEHLSAIFDHDEEKIAYAEHVISHPRTGTIPCMAVDAKGDISATTTKACLEALGRIARHYKNDKKKLGTFHIYFYALNKDGVHGAASLWRNGYEENKQAAYAVHDGSESRLVACKAFFDEAGGDQ